MSCLGLSVSKNSIEFICRISHTLSKTASHLTYEFLKESIAGISKINTEQKYLCLEYIIPWISNVTHLESGATETQSPNSKIFEILKSLIDLTVREKQVILLSNNLFSNQIAVCLYPTTYMGRIRAQRGSHRTCIEHINMYSNRKQFF